MICGTSSEKREESQSEQKHPLASSPGFQRNLFSKSAYRAERGSISCSRKPLTFRDGLPTSQLYF